MKTERPVINRTYVTATDAITKKSRCITIYGATPDKVMQAIRRTLNEQKPNKAAVPAASA